MAITIREVALLAGVSQATAARALNGYGAVSQRTVDKVMLAAQQLGYQPNRVAQALRLGQTKYVGFVPGDLENPFFATVARNLSDLLEQQGYTLLVSSSDERLDRERRIVETLKTHLVSGLVVAPAFGFDRSHLTGLAEARVPLVIIDRPVEGLDADTVTVDNIGGAQQGVEHLLDLGHERIGFLGDDLQIASSSQRLEGFRRAHSARRLLVDEEQIKVGTSSSDGGYQAAIELLQRSPRVTAVFASDNFMTLGVLRAAYALDIEVPAQLSLVGFDDFDFMTATRPTVSAIAQPIAEIGRQAAELLITRLQGYTGLPRVVVLPTTFIPRESSTRPSTSAPPGLAASESGRVG